MIYYPLFFLVFGAFIVAVYWNGFFKENRDPELNDYARRRNETFFVLGVGIVAVSVVWLSGAVALSAV